MAFKAAVLSTIDMELGENGHPELNLNGLGSNLVGLYSKLLRGLDEQELTILMDACIAEAMTPKYQSLVGTQEEDSGDELIINLIVLCFQTRWARGGKTEKMLFYKMYKHLHKHYSEVMIELMELIPHYGYWKDLLLLLCEIKKSPLPGVDYTDLESKAWQMFADQLKKDYNIFSNKTSGEMPTLTFCAKWAPSEKKEYDKSLNAVTEICKLLYPKLVSRKKWVRAKIKYRGMVSSLRVALEVPEVLMCAKRYDELKVEHITSLCLNRKMKAFLNEKLKVPLKPSEERTGNRFPDDQRRVAMRQKLLEHIITKGVAGKQLLPHELVANVLSSRIALTSGVQEVVNAQWKEIVKDCKEQIQARTSELQKQGKAINFDLSNMICMADVSGSMEGDPMNVSIALGILVSELAPEAFRDIVMTFSERPTWHHLPNGSSFVQKVKSLKSADWGGSTNFEKAVDMILQLVLDHNLTAEKVPSLLVVSDMQFDAASGSSSMYGRRNRKTFSWSTSYKRIKCAFAAIGMEPPTIIFLNVRSGTVGFPAAADDQGTMLLSGWSPSVFKYLMSGDIDQEEATEEGAESRVVKKKPTPEDTLKAILSDTGLEPVREVLENNRYKFTVKKRKFAFG